MAGIKRIQMKLSAPEHPTKDLNMTTGQLVYAYEQSKEKPEIFGTPGGAFSPEELAGEMIKQHGLSHARTIAQAKAGTFPASWDIWYRVSMILQETQDG